MGDTSETNTKVLSRELFLGVVALKCLYRKIIICATRTLFSGTVTYSILLVSMGGVGKEKELASERSEREILRSVQSRIAISESTVVLSM